MAAKVVVGWREFVSLPEWGVRRVRAKIDTGARTSAIHVAGIEELPDGRIRFEVVTRERPQRRTVWVEATPVRESRVKPSSGKRQERPVVQTTLVLGDAELPFEVSLVCRQGMLCRMLIGRSALADRFVVDPDRRYLVSRPPRRKVNQEEAG